MKPEIKKIYESGLRDILFLRSMKEIGGIHQKPETYSSDLDKQLFTAAYFGWLVGRHGLAWKQYL